MRSQLRNKSCLVWIGMIWAAVGGSTVMGEDRTDAYNLTGPQAIKAVLIAQVEAWNAHDIEMFMETYWNSESLSFSSGGKTTLGWKDMDGNFTLVFRIIEGHWKIVHDHSSLREEEASLEE